MADVTATKDKVQRILTDEFGPVQVDRDSHYTLRHGSARVFIAVRELGDDRTVVQVFCPTNRGITPSPELFHFVATNNSYMFGSLSAIERDDGTIEIFFGHTLLGDTLDPEELTMAVAMIAGTADDLDTEIMNRFGGSTFHDDPE